MSLDSAILDELKSCCKDDAAFERMRALLEARFSTCNEVESMLQHTVEVLQGEVREQIRIEEELAAQEQFYRSLFENANIGLAFKKNDKIVRANRAYLEMLGYSADEIAQKTLADITHLDDLPQQLALNAQLVRGEISQYTLTKRYIRKDGSVIWSEINGSAFRDKHNQLIFLIVAKDITLQKQMEAERELLYEQLLQSQKMESIGVLASGVAHEFNNILAGILGATTLLKKEVVGNPKAEKRVAQIETASQRAATIVKQMLGFARKGKMNVQTIDLRQCIKNVLNMVEPTIDKPIVVKTDFQVDDATAFIEGDEGQLEQVILNLAVNARDALLEAIPPIDNPEISLTLACETTPKNLASESSLPSDMKMLHLAVRDNGIGMSKEVQAKMFEPFFTTKEVGKGTGLGLSMVYGIVKNHQGFISVESTVGEGTTFHLYFPLSEKWRMQIHSKENSDVIGAMKGTILVVDDEPFIREFLSEILEENGFLVYTESSGKSGLAFFEAHREEIDLVVTDRNMPELDGERLLMQLKSIRPSLPVILITGNIENDITDRLEQSGAHKVLRKPFDPEDLLSAIASALQSN